MFSKFTSSEQYCTAALHQDTQEQKSQTPQTGGKSKENPVQHHLPQQEIQETGLSEQIISSSDNDKLNVATVVRQIIKELSEAVSEEDKVMIATMMILDLMQGNGC
jgi:hypothetical protein